LIEAEFEYAMKHTCGSAVKMSGANIQNEELYNLVSFDQESKNAKYAREKLSSLYNCDWYVECAKSVNEILA
jgi:hypothetical protein